MIIHCSEKQTVYMNPCAAVQRKLFYRLLPDATEEEIQRAVLYIKRSGKPWVYQSPEHLMRCAAQYVRDSRAALERNRVFNRRQP